MTLNAPPELRHKCVRHRVDFVHRRCCECRPHFEPYKLTVTMLTSSSSPSPAAECGRYAEEGRRALRSFWVLKAAPRTGRVQRGSLEIGLLMIAASDSGRASEELRPQRFESRY